MDGHGPEARGAAPSGREEPRIGERRPIRVEPDGRSRADSPATRSAGYPAELARGVRLRDGTYLRIRPIRPDDEPRLFELYDRLGTHTAYQRFFTAMRRLPPDWARFFANVDYRERLALVAERDTAAGPQLVGVGRYEPSEEADTAEVAFVVEDGWQGRGLGTVLLADLLAAAVARGIRRFRAYVLADNRRMLGLLARRTDILERRMDDGVVALLFSPPGPAAPAARDGGAPGSPR
jgi:RimJ/RimL family protein N-acetyltransferase